MQRIKPSYPNMAKPKVPHEFRMSDETASSWFSVFRDVRSKLNQDETATPKPKGIPHAPNPEAN